MAVIQLLETIEGAEYGGGDTVDVQSSLEIASQLIDSISPVLQRRSLR
jgi:hypothetical protein